MKDGTIKTRYGRAFISTGDYVKDFKTFWHWWMKINAKKGKPLIDITEDLDRRGEKPKFVYFTKEDFEKILLKASYDIKPIISLAFDAGCRVTELLNTRISDFRNDFTEFEIRVWQ